MTDAAALEAPETDPRWSLARDLFAAGETGAEVCRRLDLSPSTFWARANREAWLRRDRPASIPQDEPIDLDGEVQNLDVALDIAWRYLCRALKRGSSAEAARWDRVHANLEARVAARAAAQRQRGRDSVDHALAVARQYHDDVETTLAAMSRRRAALTRDLEKVESKKPDSSPAPAPLDPNAPGLSRAERRRRLAYLAKRR